MTDTTAGEGVLTERLAKAFAERDGFTWTNERVLMTGRGGSRTRLTFVRQAEEYLAVVEKAGLALAAQPSAGARSFQARVLPWLMECFGADIAADLEERCDRFIEEALEQVQALHWPRERALALVDYVYGRPIGEPHQEAGGVMVTFAALCQAAGLDMQKAGDDELARIMRPEIVQKIRAKQAAKPTGSALPIPTPAQPDTGDVAALREALERQCDNMAFILNRAQTYDWYEKFCRELAEDRAALSKPNAQGREG